VKPSHFQVVTIVLVLALVLLGAKLESMWRKARERARGRAAVKRGLLAEREAEDFLKAQGYTLVERHTPGSYGLVVDGEPQVVQLKADYLLEKAGKRIVAEVKTGKAVKIDHPETRRQMLEYQLAFGVESLLLVDMEARTARVVRFPLPKKPAPAPASSPAAKAQRASRRWTVIAVVGVVLAWLLTRPGDHEPSHAPRAEHARDDPRARARDEKPADKPARAPGAKRRATQDSSGPGSL